MCRMWIFPVKRPANPKRNKFLTLPLLQSIMAKKAAVPDYIDWNPGLDNGAKTLAAVIKTLPANEPTDISAIVKLFENPASPIALPGAVNLERHDCIHILLGRGLLPQDEAFVIGFTMGTSKYISGFAHGLFKKASRYLYPKPYKFSKDHLIAFELGMQYGKVCKASEIYEFPFEKFTKDKLGILRKRLGIKISDLRQIYRTEKILLPDSKASKRLDV